MFLIAHSGGFSWDEALVFALPVVVLVVLQVLGRRKRDVDGEPAAGEGGGDGGDGGNEGEQAG
jgi:hypothetical protein